MRLYSGSKLKRAFDYRSCRRRPYDVARGALAEQQREGIHDHRFPARRLARQDVEAGLERQGDVGNDGKIPHSKLCEHYFRVLSLKSPQCSFLAQPLEEALRTQPDQENGRSARRTSSRHQLNRCAHLTVERDEHLIAPGGIGWIDTTAVAGKTSGRTARVWGQIAVTTIASTVGTTIGPPADIEYAVEPVGVLTMMPSAEYWATSSPSTDHLESHDARHAALCTTTSLSTSGSTDPAWRFCR